MSTFHQETRGCTRSRLEMSGNLSFRDEKAAAGVTLQKSMKEVLFDRRREREEQGRLVKKTNGE